MQASIHLSNGGRVIRSKIHASASAIDRMIAESVALLRRGKRPHVIYL